MSASAYHLCVSVRCFANGSFTSPGYNTWLSCSSYSRLSSPSTSWYIIRLCICLLWDTLLWTYSKRAKCNEANYGMSKRERARVHTLLCSRLRGPINCTTNIYPYINIYMYICIYNWIRHVLHPMSQGTTSSSLYE